MLVLSLIGLYIYTSALFGFVITKVPFVKSSSRDLISVLTKYGVTSKDILIDLGCGTGHILFDAEKALGLKAVGYEYTSWNYYYALFKKRLLKSNIQFNNSDFLKADLSTATVIYTFLLSEVLPPIWSKIKTECKPGTLIIARGFAFEGVEPIEQIGNGGLKHLFIYKI
jgi:ribosomal protein L11 methylase PrmA